MTLTGAILITGGSGTLGKAIMTVAERERWDATFTVYSRSELRQAQLRPRFPRARYILGDVCDADRLAAAVAGHDIVIHAGAVKRIPEAEQQPLNCIDTNVVGTANIVRACALHGVKTCVGISTDKACGACTTYGASKLLLESLFRAAPPSDCSFVVCRYGNVIASNGSVIPIWRDQAKAGRPLTITDERMTRFWMAPSDAVKVIEHTALAPNRSIYVPKMGALPIAEMACIVAPGADMVSVGLRSTEKLHEDLIVANEPAEDRGDHYLIYEGGRGGLAYSSETAPRLSREAFLTMLAEAENYE